MAALMIDVRLRRGLNDWQVFAPVPRKWRGLCNRGVITSEVIPNVDRTLPLLRIYDASAQLTAPDLCTDAFRQGPVPWPGSTDYVRPNHKTLNVDVQNLGRGSGFVFEMRTGNYQYCHGKIRPALYFVVEVRTRAGSESRFENKA